MSSRKSVLLLVAAFVAILTVVIARVLMAPGQQAQEQKEVIPTSQVLAVAHDMPMGSILKEMDLKWIPWSDDAAKSGKFYIKGKTEMSSLVGAVVRDGLHTDDPIMVGHVVQTHEQGFLAAVLTPGKRAMSLTLTPTSGVAGFIFPGDHVDVILTHSFSRKDVDNLNDRFVSETVITDARVLALDQRSDNQSTDPKIAQVATIEVTPKQAEKLALAANLTGQGSRGGTLSLALRSLAVDENGNTVNQPVGGTTWDSDVSSAYPSMNGDDGLLQHVQVMRGKDISQSNFERRHKP